MNPQTLSCEDIAALDDAKLLVYFQGNARYDKRAQIGYQYNIRFGASSLFSDDTADLFDQFRTKVRRYTPPILPHVWTWLTRGKKNVLGCNICGVKQTEKNKEAHCKGRAARTKKQRRAG